MVISAPVLLAILIPTIGKVRETAHRTADASSLRQVCMAALIYANGHNDQCPPANLEADGTISQKTPATIHAVAAALARDGGLNDSSIWFRDAMDAVLSADRTTVNPAFARQQTFAWDFATGLNASMSPMTPIAWTRGLSADGTWDKAGVYGTDGGYIAFLGGNVAFFRDLKQPSLVRPDGTRTSNILEALPASARVVGAGPATLHGAAGLAPR